MALKPMSKLRHSCMPASDSRFAPKRSFEQVRDTTHHARPNRHARMRACLSLLLEMRYSALAAQKAAVVSDANALLTLSKWAAPPMKACLTSRPEGRDSPSLQGADP